MSDITEMGQLYLSVGDQTEDLVAFIANGLDDETLDEVEVGRIINREDLASEPITIGVILFLGGAGIYAVTRLLEKWMEGEREKEFRRDLYWAWAKDPELGKQMGQIEETHSDLVKSQGMVDFHDLDSSSWSGPALSLLSQSTPVG